MEHGLVLVLSGERTVYPSAISEQNREVGNDVGKPSCAPADSLGGQGEWGYDGRRCRIKELRFEGLL